MSKECPFCNANFLDSRKLNEKQTESPLSRIIKNDFPYGPYFHYMAIPRAQIHSWQDITEEILLDLNTLILHFLKRHIESTYVDGSKKMHIRGGSGVNIGLNSTIRHLVMTRHSRASAGASIAHIHKQIWGMTDLGNCLSNYCGQICEDFSKHGIDYLQQYLDELYKNGFVIWSDNNIALYVPIGQMSLHEIQIMVKKQNKNFYKENEYCNLANYPGLNEEIIASISKAEYIAIQIFRNIGISSFNEVFLSQGLNNTPTGYRLIIAFVTREIDLAVSELNHLYVVDKHPESTIEEIIRFQPEIEKICDVKFEQNLGHFLV